MFLFVLFCFVFCFLFCFFSQFIFHPYWLRALCLIFFFFAECKVGYFKDKLGNTECTECPLNSVTETVDRKYCKCKRGFFRAAWEKITDNCTGRSKILYLWDEILMVRQSDIHDHFSQTTSKRIIRDKCLLVCPSFCEFIWLLLSRVLVSLRILFFLSFIDAFVR